MIDPPHQYPLPGWTMQRATATNTNNNKKKQSNPPIHAHSMSTPTAKWDSTLEKTNNYEKPMDGTGAQLTPNTWHSKMPSTHELLGNTEQISTRSGLKTVLFQIQEIN